MCKSYLNTYVSVFNDYITVIHNQKIKTETQVNSQNKVNPKTF